MIKKIYVKDYPSFFMRGVIEGFYGKPYTQNERLELLDIIKEYRMNTYIYAPKDDLYHREKWREDYPFDEIEKLKELYNKSKKNHIDFYFAISPGKDFNFSSQDDYQILLNKLNSISKIGINKFALLMDDIDAKLKDEEKTRFVSIAQAHSYLANQLNKDLKKASNLLLCPTDYMQNFDTAYRQDIKKYLEDDICVFWTGYNTVAEAITDTDGNIVKNVFNKNLVLWDNYPVNDFNPKRRIYFGAINNRGKNLNNTHIGYIANLSELFECSKIPLYTMADYAWDTQSYDAKTSLEIAVNKYFKKCKNAGRFFVMMNESNIFWKKYPIKEIIDKKGLFGAEKLYKKVRQSLITIKSKCSKKFLIEIDDLIKYMNAECDLYFTLIGKEKNDLNVIVKTLNESKYATPDTTICKMANEQLKLNINIDQERFCYRSWNE